MTEARTCINDQPIENDGDDLLTTRIYSEGLARFIMSAATPITIGIQGGWGSGKTSLMNLLKGNMEAPASKAACISVNAWEHSLFNQDMGGGGIAVSILSDILCEIEKHIIEGKPESSNTKSSFSSAFTRIKKAVGIATEIGVRVVAKNFVGVELPTNSTVGGLAGQHGSADKPEGAQQTQVAEVKKSLGSLAEAVRALKEMLNNAVKDFIEESGHTYTRFVCFVDDLDRVQPQTAVEILDVLKNIFDINGCVFVLAIDYDVVVKGLSAKFGEKTEENEREFRQYFDKIIQIPFTMPVGSYREHLRKFIKEFLEPLGYAGRETLDDDALKDMAEAAHLTTGGVPRAIKRIVNTTSLLRHIGPQPQERGERVGDESESKLEEPESRRQYDLALTFTVVAIHISFPELCRYLMLAPDFTAWKFEALQKEWSLSREQYDHIKDSKDEWFDEPWEKVVYCLCAKNSWLAKRRGDASKILNLLRNRLQGHTQPPASPRGLNDREVEALVEKIDLIRVVAVDSDNMNNVDDSNYKQDRINVFCRDWHKTLMDRAPWLGLPPTGEKIWAKGGVNGQERNYDIPISKDGSSFEWAGLEWYAKEGRILVYFIPPCRRGFKNKSTYDELHEALKNHPAIAADPHGLSYSDTGSFWFALNGFASKDDFDFKTKADGLMVKSLNLANALRDVCADIMK